jgi:hypothetical protein
MRKPKFRTQLFRGDAYLTAPIRVDLSALFECGRMPDHANGPDWTRRCSSCGTEEAFSTFDSITFTAKVEPA